MRVKLTMEGKPSKGNIKGLLTIMNSPEAQEACLCELGSLISPMYRLYNLVLVFPSQFT